MSSADFRVESNHPIATRLLPESGSRQYFFSDRALAITMAAKSTTKPVRSGNPRGARAHG